MVARWLCNPVVCGSNPHNTSKLKNHGVIVAKNKAEQKLEKVQANLPASKQKKPRSGSLSKRLEANGFNLEQEILKLARSRTLPEKDKKDLLVSLLPYYYAKKKPKEEKEQSAAIFLNIDTSGESSSTLRTAAVEEDGLNGKPVINIDVSGSN